MRYGLIFAILIICAAQVCGDVVHLKDGRKLEGESRWTGEGLELKTKYGTVTFRRADVLRVEKKETPAQEYARRLKALDPADLEAAFALASFCAQHKQLTDKAAPLLLDVEKRSQAQLSATAEAKPDERKQVALRKLRLQVADALRKLDYHQVEGKWLAPDVYYPARGYVKLGKRWVKKEVAERRRASRERRAAKREAKVAKRAARKSAKNLAEAQENLDAALRGYSKSQARTKHYVGEVKRLGAEVKTKDAERILLEADVRRLRSELTLVQARYTAWHGKPCACRAGSCRCGWHKRDRALALIVRTADANYWKSYNELKRLEKTLTALRAGEAKARALLAKARKTEAEAKSELAISKLDLEDAQRRAESAKTDAEDKQDDLKDADRKVKDLGGK